MDEIKELIKSLTAETQSTQREEFLPNRETTIGQNLLVFNGDKFLFVVVSRQTKKGNLCDLCASAVIKFNALSLALCALRCVSLALLPTAFCQLSFSLLWLITDS